MRPNRVSIRTGFPRPELKREHDPVFWDAHHAKINARVADAAARRPENWPHGRQLALLMIQRSHMALDCIANMSGVRASQEDFAWLRKEELAIKDLGERYHTLTAEGKRLARDCCFAVATRLGLHHFTYSFDSWSEHVARCTCGWHQSLNRRNNNGGASYLQERARRHLADPDAWKRENENIRSIIDRAFPLASEDPDAIDDAVNVYGDDWPEVDTPCDKSPVEQCEFNAADPDHCIHCKGKT